MDSVICSICLGVLYRPIELPCLHVFCKDCILESVNQASFQCPICRFRLSNWLRKVKDINNAISSKHEDEIRTMFPNYYEARELGKSPVLSEKERRLLSDASDGMFFRSFFFGDSLLTDGPISKVISSSGEIFSEYSKEVEKAKHLRAMEDRENEEASLALAFQLLAEDQLNVDMSTIDEGPSTETLEVTPLPNKSMMRDFNLPPRLTMRKTLLDFAVHEDVRNQTHETEDVVDPLGEQMLRDEAFARSLQAKYSKSPVAQSSAVSSTRHKRRTMRSKR